MSKGKTKNMIEIRDVIHRLRNGQTHRCIDREIGVDRSIVSKIHALAIAHDWLNSTLPMPRDEEIAKVWIPKPKIQNHVLNVYHEELKQWHSSGHSAIVIHRLLKDKCPCDIQAIRRYLRRHFPKPVEPVMVRPTLPGKDMEVDFGYLGVFLDENNERKKTWIFSARLRHSRRAYREIVLNQNSAVFLGCHVRAFEYFNGVVENVVLDNTKAAIIQSTIDNDMVSRSYQELAEHYGFMITPCLPRTPQHKGGVEGDMKYVKNNFLPYFYEKQKERNIKQPLLQDLIIALEKWEKDVADIHIIYGIGRSPLEIFKTEEEKALRSLPNSRWELTSWSQSSVRRDWRIMHDGAYYSVPYKLIGKTVQVCTTSACIRIFFDHQEVAFHERAKIKWEYKRKSEHAPPLEEEVLNCSLEGLLVQAEKIGPFTHQVALSILSNHLVNKLRSVRLLLKLGNKYSRESLEKACQRASAYKLYSYNNVKTILENNLEDCPVGMSLTNKIVPIPQFRFARDPADYKSSSIKDAPKEKSFTERLEEQHPHSKFGNAMNGVWNSLMGDQIIEEEEKR